MGRYAPGRGRSRIGVRLVLLAALLLSGAGYSMIGNPQSAVAQPVIFGDGLLPAPNSTVPAGAVVVGCTVNSALDLQSVDLTVDGVPVATTLSADGPPWQVRGTATVQAGTHTVAVNATDSAGQAGGWTWTFTASGSAPAPTPRPATPTPPAAPTPTVPPGRSPVILPVAPVPGWVVPVGTQRIAVRFGTDSGWRSRAVALDGSPLTLHSEGAAAGSEDLAATVPISAGLHTVLATATDTLGRQGRAQWTFLASGPANSGDLRITPLAPVPGATLDSGNSVRIAARLETSATLGTSALWLDGQKLNPSGSGDVHLETLFAEVTGVTTGTHSVRVQAADNGGQSQDVAWTFDVGQPASTPDRTYYAQTGFAVSGPFQQYWQSLGANALQLLGLPISGLLVERLDDGHDYTVQYFERVRLEWHPENTGTESEILYGLLGTQFHQPDPAIARPAPQPGAQYFPETGHLVSGPFLQKWQSTGGLRVHGYPISEELQEVSPTDGRVYLVQYFQRARFEYHPENAGTPFEILLGMLGRQLYNQRYPGP